MTRELTYAEQVAPYPGSEDPDVAQKLARYLACLVQGDITHTFGHYYMSAPIGDKQAARDYALVIGRMVRNFGTLSLLRTLIARDPELANSAARQLVDDWNAGEAIGEWGLAMAGRLRDRRGEGPRGDQAVRTDRSERLTVDGPGDPHSPGPLDQV